VGGKGPRRERTDRVGRAPTRTTQSGLGGLLNSVLLFPPVQGNCCVDAAGADAVYWSGLLRSPETDDLGGVCTKG